MLILVRELGEAIQIGDDIQVRVCAIDPRGSVRLGFAAPSDVTILREELTIDAQTTSTSEPG